jgi:tetratricopeptide (TPR) repeat protein
VLVVLIGTAGFVGHACLCRDQVAFLWDREPARWIVYSQSRTPASHRLVPLETVFRRSFLLESAPGEADLYIRAFRACAISINGRRVPGPFDVEHWKHGSRFEVGSLLRAGRNELSVTVTNSQGPPALWLALFCPNNVLATDASWEASLAGATWRPAALAADPVPFAGIDKNRTYDGVAASLGKVWPMWVVFAAGSALVVFLVGRWRRARPPGENDEKLRAALAGAAEHTAAVESARHESAHFRRAVQLNWLLLGAIAIFWIAMFLHNSPFLSSSTGFDARGHLKYIDHFRAKWTVLLPGEIWESHQPPLYHFLAAVLLSATGYATESVDGMLTIRLFNLVLALINITVIWLSLRLIFPCQTRRWAIGLLVAGLLPMDLYMYQTPTNHLLGTTLASVTVYLMLRILSLPGIGAWDYLFLGLATGGALLSGLLNGLLVPPLVLALALKLYADRARAGWPAVILRLSLFAATAFAVCGWFYIRIWIRFGTPIVSNTGSGPGAAWAWWQDPGYRMAGDYLRFGQSLRDPFFSVWYSVWDGLYATLWGDSYLSGWTSFTLSPPWSHDYLAAGMVLALLPTLAIALAAICAVVEFLRKPSILWAFLLAVAYLVGSFLIYGPIINPTYAAVKTFYGLAIAVPLCAFAAWGLDLFAGRSRWGRRLVFVFLGMWSLNVAATYWIWPSALETKRYSALLTCIPREAGGSGDELAGICQFEDLLAEHPDDAATRIFLTKLLLPTAPHQHCWELLKLQPGERDTAPRHILRGLLLAKQGDAKEALRELQMARDLDPDNLEAAQVYYLLASKLSDLSAIIDICCDVLRINPYQINFHTFLSQLYRKAGSDDLARLHQEYAAKLTVAEEEVNAAMSGKKRLDK